MTFFYWFNTLLWLVYSLILQKLMLVCQNPAHNTVTDMICYKISSTTESIISLVYTSSFEFQSNSTPQSMPVFPSQLQQFPKYTLIQFILWKDVRMTNFLETGFVWGCVAVGAAVLNKKDITGLRKQRHSAHECKNITELGLQNC